MTPSDEITAECHQGSGDGDDDGCYASGPHACAGESDCRGHSSGAHRVLGGQP